MTMPDTTRRLLARIAEQRNATDNLRQHWRGEQGPAYLSKASAKLLDQRLSRLAVNFPRLAVTSIAERLDVTGITRAGSADEHDAAAWDSWRRLNLPSLSALVHTDRLTYGAAYVTVWGASDGQPAVTADSLRTMTARVDPVNGDVLEACRSWADRDGSHAIHYTPDAITRYDTDRANTDVGGDVASALYGGWTRGVSVPNPFGVTPVVPFVRRVSLEDYERGTSAMADILDLSDALAKVLQDAMVTSEVFARPRRWATGLEIEYDDEGSPIDPFRDDRKLVSEAPETKFGQFDASRVDGYTDLVATLTQLIGAATGLPPHYLGLHGDQPASADGIRSAEAQLVQRVYAEQRQLDVPWSRVLGLIQAITNGADVPTTALLPVWESPEVRTGAQAADAAAKLREIGVPLAAVLRDPMGYAPDRIDEVIDAQREENRANLTAALVEKATRRAE